MQQEFANTLIGSTLKAVIPLEQNIPASKNAFIAQKVTDILEKSNFGYTVDLAIDTRRKESYINGFLFNDADMDSWVYRRSGGTSFQIQPGGFKNEADINHTSYLRDSDANIILIDLVLYPKLWKQSENIFLDIKQAFTEISDLLNLHKPIEVSILSKNVMTIGNKTVV